MLESNEYRNFKHRPKKLVIMLHGYGSNKEDLISLAPELSKAVPDSIFISPSAPFEFESMPKSGGKQWFSLLDKSKEALLSEMKKPETLLVNFITEQLARFNLTDRDLCLLGFSQGTMMSLYLVLQLCIKPKLLVAFSGRSFEHQWSCGANKKSTKILLIHGQEDDIVTIENMYQTQELLRSYNYTTSSHVSRYLAHGIDEDGVKVCCEFLKNNFS